MKKLFTLALFAVAFAAHAAGPVLTKPVLDGTDAFGANSIPNAYPLTPISMTAGPVLPKPVLDGTDAFGANSIPNAYPLSPAMLAGPVLTKPVLDGTNAFGANSVANAFDLNSVGTTFGSLKSDDGRTVAQGN